MIGDGFCAGDPVTLVSFTTGRLIGRFSSPGGGNPFLLASSDDAPFVHYVYEGDRSRVLAGHLPGLLATLAEALADAAAFWEPGRCGLCDSGPVPCEQCDASADEEKVRVYRALHEALTAAPQAALGPAPGSA